MSYHRGIKKKSPKNGSPKKKGPVPKGFHRMPNGKLMRGSTHGSKRKK